MSKIEIAAGYASPYFVNNAEQDVVQYEDAYVLLVDGKITNIPDLVWSSRPWAT
ncbi:hypothetical protein ACFXKR_37165 [Streptomyces violascens]|uniref:hypothetical protein n=1 Tax=Streptomyces violascens TaxID=67381 RepID=UPI0036A96661